MLVAVASLKGSPGVTTLAVGLADRWPAEAEAVVVEADPAGGDLAARFGLAPAPGLVSLAATARRATDAELLWEHTQELPGGLLVVAAPAGAEQARAVLTELRGGGVGVLRAAANHRDVMVVADCGRLDADSAAVPVVRAADVLLVLVRVRDDELSHLAAKLTVITGWRLQAWFVVVAAQHGKPEGHRVRELSRVLGPLILGPVVPYDPAAAAVLGGRRRAAPGITRSRLGRAAEQLAGQLHTRADGAGIHVGTAAGREVPAAPVGLPLPAVQPPARFGGGPVAHRRRGTEWTEGS